MNRKRGISLITLLAAALSLALVAGCAQPTATPSPTPQPTAVPTIDYSVKTDYSIWLYSAVNDYYTDYSENPVVKYLDAKFNVALKYQQPAAGTEQDSLSTMFGTGDLTDMIELSYYSGSVGQLFDDKQIVDLTDYLVYMPNFKKILDSNPDFRKTVTDDNGRILTLQGLFDARELMWGGLVYRRDILKTMTGDNIQFPSGNTDPTTVADWDYMLPLIQMYFQAAGLKDAAPLILPSSGVFPMSQLVNGFGAAYNFYLDGDAVKFGPQQPGFRAYVAKMAEWYAKGYIYKDFASRTSDPFYLPNTALTYGGQAGIWFGLSSQLGDVMSMPQYSLFVDVQAVPDPIDAANGVTEAPSFARGKTYERSGAKYAVSAKCKDIPKLLSVFDYLFSDEGSMLMSYGLTKDQGAAADPIYAKAGLQDGTYSLVDGKFAYNALLGNANSGGTIPIDPFMGNRLPALVNKSYDNQVASALVKTADALWGKFSDSAKQSLPAALSRPTADDKTFTADNTQIMDYVNAEIPQFIMGTKTLDDATWKAFQDQLVALGANDCLAIQQAAYDRYKAR